MTVNAMTGAGEPPSPFFSPSRTPAQPSDSMPRLHCICDMKTDHFHSEWT
ncbi:hypothetical protein SXCC_02863 [Gluconacetobacter sp. SXCC-1]|nr:hypothetical protein SXCC_02863 [Gluconacetobacter sp. SXCC-1]